MIYIKLLGSGLIATAGGVAAYTAVHYEKRKLSVLDAWIDLIFHIRGQIDCYLMPLDDILACADTEILRACMCRAPHPDLRTLLHASSPYLTPEAKRLLTALIRELGGSYREEQLRLCDYYINALREIRNQIAADLPSRVKLCITLCICSALGTAILLW